MGRLKAFELAAMEAVHDHAHKTEAADRSYVAGLCGAVQTEAASLMASVLEKPVTLNFHPDRLSNNGKLIMENLLEEGRYLGQFQTGTSNGGKTAYAGGERFLWEQRLFSGAYPAHTPYRPKYGALNILRYWDGACARFGSCYFVLKQSMLRQCTFAYGDSSSHPGALGTARCFWGVLSALLTDVAERSKLLNLQNCPLDRAVGMLMAKDPMPQAIGRNLDDCIEVHIHGEILLAQDVEALYLDGSFRDTEIHSLAGALSKKYRIGLGWIPTRQIQIDGIDEEFRGPAIKPLAKEIDLRFGGGGGVIHAALMGKASCHSLRSPDAWTNIGNETELFQYFKQLWHTTAYYGSLSQGPADGPPGPPKPALPRHTGPGP